MIGAGTEELSTIILEDQALPQISGYMSYVYSIPNAEIFISLKKIFFILGNTYKNTTLTITYLILTQARNMIDVLSVGNAEMTL